MRIAQVSHQYFPSQGGVETVVQQIGERLLRRGNEVEILTTDATGQLPEVEDVNGVMVRRFRSVAPDSSYFFSHRLKEYLKRHSSDYEIVHAHNLHAMPVAYAARARKSNSLVVSTHYHGTGHTPFRKVAHYLWTPLVRRALNRADAIICVSKYEKALLLQRIGNTKTTPIVIPNGIDRNDFPPKDRVSRKEKDILSVGRLEKYKGIQYVIGCLPFLDGNFRLRIVGRGGYEGHLRTLASRLGVGQRVEFISFLPRDELLAMYRDSDVFVQLSDSESFGITVAESLASGTPAVVRTNSPMSEWADGLRCFNVGSPENGKSLASVIERASESGGTPMSFPDWDDVVSQILSLYTSLRACS